MSGLLGNILFLNPWLLAGLLALPALWFLLRIMPPAPKRIFLPSAAFLAGLIPDEKTPSKTPWWILLLRLCIAALVIIAFARPVVNPSSSESAHSKILIVMENGWGAAHLWDRQIKTAQDIIAKAARDNREVSLATSAPQAGKSEPAIFGPLAAGEAGAILKGLEVLPWPSDYAALSKVLPEVEDTQSYWLSDGLEHKGTEELAERLAESGGLRVFKPTLEELPAALNFSEAQKDAFSLIVPEGMPKGLSFSLQALNENGGVIGLQSVDVSDDNLKAVKIDIPATLRSEMRQIRIAERGGAGGTLISGDRFSQKSVGIVSPLQDAEAKPFIEASYYLTRAMEPFADVKTGTIEDILSQDVSLIVLPDIGAMSPLNLDRLEKWVRAGGLLLRFAGPAMSDASGTSRGGNFLIPTPLRKGKRALGGALSWEDPPKLAVFPEGSPLNGLEISEDVTVRQQLLAEPAPDLAQKTWASLNDGTPLITADALDQGLLVMVHTTASPDWSDLPLSGMFVQIMQRFVKLAGTAPESLAQQSGTLQPLLVLDGQGRLGEPDSSAAGINAEDFEKTRVSPTHPPGIYGRAGYSEALNLGAQIKSLSVLPDFGADVQTQVYGQSHERDLMPHLLLAALILVLVDWFAMLILSADLRFRILRPAAVVLALICITSPVQADVKPSDLEYADGFYLAYIKSPDASVNEIAQRGLEGLSDALESRTSAEPAGIAALNPETDTLSFFPLIYWPVSANDQALSERALANIQSYLDHGGTILFDTRDQNVAASTLSGTPNGAALQRMIAGLNIPALGPIPKDHVLGRSFYLLSAFPGRYQGGTLWVETTSTSGRDGVSSVLIGSHDWAGAWAENLGRDYRSGTQSRQREMATRFGVNVVMYALTGNYKADQVHVENILNRLGQ